LILLSLRGELSPTTILPHSSVSALSCGGLAACEWYQHYRSLLYVHVYVIVTVLEI